jgi:energy-coupling factor transporter ATP-binding protein EcfA2
LININDIIKCIIQRKIINIQDNTALIIDSDMSTFIKQRIRNYNIFNNPVQTYFNIYEVTHMLSPNYKTKHKFYNMKYNNNDLFRIIQNKFKDITEKEIDIDDSPNQITEVVERRKHKDTVKHPYFSNLQYISHTPQKYPLLKYVIKPHSFNCSAGEEELMNFLVCFYDNESNIIFVDDQCTRLSSQNMEKFRREVLEQSSNNKQLIMVTHNIEMISPKTCENVIRFNLRNNQTIPYYIPKNDMQSTIKLICEHKEILFANKVLLCEGWGDYIIFREFIKVFNIYDIIIVALGGKGIPLWKVLDYFDICYKSIYDYDLIYDKKRKINKGSIKKIVEMSLHKNIYDIRQIENDIAKFPNKNEIQEYINSKQCSTDKLRLFIFKYLSKFKDLETIKKQMNIIMHQINESVNRLNDDDCFDYEFSRETHNFDNKIFIWNHKIEKLEGFAKIFLPEEKMDITKIPIDLINKGISDHQNNQEMKNLEAFLVHEKNDSFKNLFIDDVINFLKRRLSKSI